ncbi:MAG: peptide MFS transporter, partial [Terriglobales bacterium]
WERFSYYGMRALLVLYMVAPAVQGGLAFTTEFAMRLYGIYTMLVYVTSIPGGFIADNYLGARRSVLIGGIIIACGHFALAVPSMITFYFGLSLIILGTGLLKPNVSTMLGCLYPAGDQRRDSGFSIYYMGINIGAALAPLVCGFLAQSTEFKSFLSGTLHADPLTSWHWGFAAAGVGMIFGLLQFVLGGKTLGTVGIEPSSKKSSFNAPGNVQGPLTADECKRLGAIGILFLFAVLFWAIYEQGGSSLNLFADKLTDCRIFDWRFPSSWFQTLPALFVIILAPLFSQLWVKLGSKEPSSPAKFAYGLFFLGLGILVMVPASVLSQHDKASPFWLFSVFLLMCVGEMCLSPVGLSTVTKLAPARFLSLTMGVWMLTNGLGNYLNGELARFFNQHDVAALVYLFGGMAVAVFVCTVVLALLVPT